MAREGGDLTEVIGEQPAKFRFQGWRESFWKPDLSAVMMLRPPAAELELVLDDLSHGFTTSQMQSARVLAKDIASCDENHIHDLLQLLDQFRKSGNDMAARLPNYERDYKPNFVWAITWFSLPLLDYIMSRVRSEQIGQIKLIVGWWAQLFNLWPAIRSCIRTKIALDLNRRVFLLEFDYEAQAIDGYPSTWKGLEKCELLVLAAEKHSALEHHDMAVQFIRKAEKAGTKESSPLWPCVKLLMGLKLCAYLKLGMRYDEAAKTEAKFLFEVQRVDLRLQFDKSMADELKLQIMMGQATFMSALESTDRRKFRGLREPVQELTTELILTMSSDEQLRFLFVRGMQLLVLDRIDDAILELKRCLSMILAQGDEWVLGVSLRDQITRALAEGQRRAGVDWSKGSLDTGEFNSVNVYLQEKMERVLRDVDLRDKMTRVLDKGPSMRAGVEGSRESVNSGELSARDVRVYLQGSNAFDNVFHAEYLDALNEIISALDSLDSAGRTRRKKVYWKTWETLRLHFISSITDGRKNLKRSNVAYQDYCMSETYRSRCFVMYLFLKMHLIINMSPNLVWPSPPESPFQQDRRLYVESLARSMLVLGERFQPYIILSQGLESDLEWEEWEKSEWDTIIQGLNSCGSGTLFLAYDHGYDRGLATGDIVSVLFPDGSIKCISLGSYLKENAEKTANEILSAMDKSKRLKPGERELSDLEVRDRLDSLYDLLIRPVFSAPGVAAMMPQQKIVIMSTGCVANVPFGILRNKDTGQYLFEEVTLSITPSFQLVHQCYKRYEELRRRPLFGPGAAIALGDPAYEYPNTPLPGSGKEVSAIFDLFNIPAGENVSGGMSDFDPHRTIAYYPNEISLREAIARRICSPGFDFALLREKFRANLKATGETSDFDFDWDKYDDEMLLKVMDAFRKALDLEAGGMSGSDSSRNYQIKELLKENATIQNLLDWTVSKLKIMGGPNGTTEIMYSQGFIHIAAHARVDQSHPRGTLVLAPDSNKLSMSTVALDSSQSATRGQELACPDMAGSSEDPQARANCVPGISGAVNTRLEDMAEEHSDLLRGPTTLDSHAGILPSTWILTSGKEWSAYMVVLSACESGNGQVDERMGTFNLGRAFMLRGIPCSVLSQWPVDDSSTAHLMTLFYKAMRKGEDASSALRLAMLNMLKSGNFRLHQWAPFVVSGLPTVRLPPELQE